MREILQMPELNLSLIEELKVLIDYIATTMEHVGYIPGDYPNVIFCDESVKDDLQEKLDIINEKTNKVNNFLDFADYWEAESLEEIAIETSLLTPPVIPDMTVEEAGEIIDIIISGKYCNYDGYYLELLEKSISNKNISDLIFWYNPDDYGHEPSGFEIAERAFKTATNQ